MNYKGIEITIKSRIADVAVAVINQNQPFIENGKVVTKQVAVELKGTLKNVKREIARLLN